MLCDDNDISRLDRRLAPEAKHPPDFPVSRNIMVFGRRTSVRLEAVWWDALAEICRREALTLHDLCDGIAEAKETGNLTAAIRLFALNYFRAAVTEEGHRRAGHGRIDV